MLRATNLTVSYIPVSSVLRTTATTLAILNNEYCVNISTRAYMWKNNAILLLTKKKHIRNAQYDTAMYSPRFISDKKYYNRESSKT